MTKMVDFARERSKFPLLLERNYMVAHSMGVFPSDMLADLRAYERSLLLRTRGRPEWVERFTEMHPLTEQLLGAPPGSVFLRDSSTAAQAALAAALEPEGARRRIVIASSDFHSSRYLWQAQAKRGFEIVEVESVGDAHGDARTFLGVLDERVRIVALSLVSPRSGALLDARPIVDAAHRAGAIVILDAYHAVGVVPVRVQELGADVIVGGYHKWLGGGSMGLAFGYVAPALSARLDPIYPGWIGHRDLLGFQDRFEPAPTAEKFQQGSPSIEPVYTSRAGLQWVLDVGIDRIRARSLELTERLIARATERGLAVRTPRDAHRRGGMVCIDLADAADIAASLETHGIDIDARPGAGARIGPHACATERECDAVIDAIASRR